MTRTSYIAPLLAAAALIGCDNGRTTVVLGPDGNEIEETPAANAANVELPPSIAESKIYRCKDGSIVYVDWLSDNKSANFRAEQTGTPVHLTAEQEGQPMTAEAYSLAGTAEASSITLERPEKGTTTCKA